MIPLFCQGKDKQAVTSAPVGLGVRLIPVTGASLLFEAGDRRFVSEGDGSACEYLGTVQSVATDSVAVEFATGATRTAGAPLWIPAALWAWPAGLGVTVRHARATGVEIRRSLGGTAYATRLLEPYEIESVRFESLPDGPFAALRAWFEDRAQDGLAEFTYIDAERAIRRVRLEAPRLEWSRSAKGLIAVGFDLQLLEALYI